jgi:hypothetical protein
MQLQAGRLVIPSVLRSLLKPAEDSYRLELTSRSDKRAWGEASSEAVWRRTWLS